ncbi:MAG: hypothetical protein JWN72_62 [Thermoleophilia bacterium]|nr:hypothetical protein [Thermoleophilia bacterium]
MSFATIDSGVQVARQAFQRGLGHLDEATEIIAGQSRIGTDDAHALASAFKASAQEVNEGVLTLAASRSESAEGVRALLPDLLEVSRKDSFESGKWAFASGLDGEYTTLGTSTTDVISSARARLETTLQLLG